MQKVIAHVDMDCFFASVEEKYNPELKKFPLIIGGLPRDNRGVVCTANYEARKFGVKSAMPIKKAYELCPKGIYLKTNKELYCNESKNVMVVLKSISDDFVQVSIDEAYLDVTNYSKKFTDLNELGKQIKKMVLKKCGLPCSVGISDSSIISKIASGYKKPLGTTVVLDKELFLADLPVKKIPGIGPKAFKNLEKKGVVYGRDLAKTDIFVLKDILGSNAYFFKNVASGKHITKKLDFFCKGKSISREITFNEDISTKNCFNYINDISKEVFKDLNNQTYKVVSIKIKFNNFKIITRDFSLPVPMANYETIVEVSKKLLKINCFETPVRLFGIKISGLSNNASSQKKLNPYISTLVVPKN